MPSPFARPVLLFDLDGTLIDSCADLASSVNEVLAGEGHAPLSEAAVRDMVGDGAAMLVRRAFAARGLEPPEGALDSFRSVYGRRCLEQTAPYAGIPELLAELAAEGRRLAVVTNKPTAFSERILEGLGLARHLRAIVGPELAREKKPSPEHVRAALQLLGAPPEDAVMVGDGPTDMASAATAGVAALGVLWGFRPAGELRAAGASHLVTTVAELRSELLGRPGKGV